MPTARDLIDAEMARQHADARASFAGAAAMAATVAESLRRTGRLRLLAMGGSHHVNTTVAFAYRALGIDVSVEVLSEALVTPGPDFARTALVTSQSGASGEVVLYLGTPAGREERFGLTLEPESPLGRGLPALIGHGGTERAFAATRSLLVSHALHAAVLVALGADAAMLDHLAPHPVDHRRAADALDGTGAFVVTGRDVTAGLAANGALCLMELSRRPALALEGGQLRHGPMEILGPDVGVIVLRAAGRGSHLAPSLAQACRDAGSPVLAFDCSGETPAPADHAITLPRASGMAAVFALLPAMQAVLVEIASRRVGNVGQPVRTSKVTVEV